MFAGDSKIPVGGVVWWGGAGCVGGINRTKEIEGDQGGEYKTITSILQFPGYQPQKTTYTETSRGTFI